MRKPTVHLFVFEGMADWEAPLAVCGTQHQHFLLPPGRFHIKTAARCLAPIRTLGGMRILPDMTIDEVCPAESSLLVLPDGKPWEAGRNLEALERALAFVNDGVPVAAIGAATLALAHTGMLDTHLHTSNNAAYLAASGYRGGHQYRHFPAITDHNLVTASGRAPLAFAREISSLLRQRSSSTLAAWHSLYQRATTSRLNGSLPQSA